jgi:hypothetical protein
VACASDSAQEMATLGRWGQGREGSTRSGGTNSACVRGAERQRRAEATLQAGVTPELCCARDGQGGIIVQAGRGWKSDGAH